MQVRQVTFERVFDVQRSQGLFSFVADGRSHYSVTLPGADVPEVGERFAFAMLDPDDFSSVVAHRKLGQQQVKLRQGSSTGVALVELIGDWYIAGLILPAFAFAVGTSVSGGVGAIAALVVLLGQVLASAAYLEYVARRNKVATQVLLDLGPGASGTTAGTA